MKVFLEDQLIHEITRVSFFEQYSTKGKEDLLEENLRQRKAEVLKMIEEAPYPLDSIQLILVLMVNTEQKFKENKTFANLGYQVSGDDAAGS